MVGRAVMVVASNSHGVGRGNCLVDMALAIGFWFRAHRVDSSIPTVLIRYTPSTDISITDSSSHSHAVTQSRTFLSSIVISSTKQQLQFPQQFLPIISRGRANDLQRKRTA